MRDWMGSRVPRQHGVLEQGRTQVESRDHKQVLANGRYAGTNFLFQARRRSTGAFTPPSLDAASTQGTVLGASAVVESGGRRAAIATSRRPQWWRRALPQSMHFRTNVSHKGPPIVVPESLHIVGLICSCSVRPSLQRTSAPPGSPGGRRVPTRDHCVRVVLKLTVDAADKPMSFARSSKTCLSAAIARSSATGPFVPTHRRDTP